MVGGEGVASSRAAGQQGTGLKPTFKGFARHLLPLAVRKHLAIWLDRQRWLGSGKWWAVELLRDFAEKDISAYHRFLWSNHMAYAETYDVDRPRPACPVGVTADPIEE